MPAAFHTQFPGRIGDDGETGFNTLLWYPYRDANFILVVAGAGHFIGIQANDVGVKLTENFTKSGNQSGPVAALHDNAVGNVSRFSVNGRKGEVGNGYFCVV